MFFACAAGRIRGMRIEVLRSQIAASKSIPFKVTDCDLKIGMSLRSQFSTLKNNRSQFVTRSKTIRRNVCED